MNDNKKLPAARSAVHDLKPYVPGKPIDEVKRELGLENIIKMASNENPLGSSPLALQALKDNIADSFLYPDANCFQLKKKLAGIIPCPVESMIIGNGSDELLKLISETFLDPGDEIIMADPTFSEYEFAAVLMNAKCIKVGLNNYDHDLTAMLAAVTDKTKIIYICNPNNPTGTIAKARDIEEFMQKVPDHILVIFDEAYIEYVEAPDFQSGIKYVEGGRNAIVLHTFSKIFGLAGLRIGYGVTLPAIAALVERVTEPFNVNSLAQIAALAALDDQSHLKSSQELNHAGKLYLYGEFDRLGLDYIKTEANFIMVDTKKDSQEVFKAMLQKGIIVRTGDIFGYPTQIRVTIGDAEQNSRFIQALTEII